MVDRDIPAHSLNDFATWAPVLRLLRDNHADGQAARTGPVAGSIGRDGWSLPLRGRMPESGRAAAERVRSALADTGVEEIAFTADISPSGRTELRLLALSPAVDPGIGTPHPGALRLVEGALPQPWRVLPDPAPGAVPAPSADPVLLERTLRERLPDAIGATEAEIAAAESRLGVPLPEELKSIYRVTRSRWEDWGDDYEVATRYWTAVGCELFGLDDLYIADAESRPCRWEFAAMEAVDTAPDAAVQGVVGSPGWIAFGDNGGGDRLAVDLTPGPAGHLRQVVFLSHEENIGASLVADSLTDLVTNRRGRRSRSSRGERPSPVAHVNIRRLPSIEAAAHPGLEVLSIGVWDDPPLSLVPVVGLPRLRTLSAYPGTLADPLEIAGLTELEFLELGPDDWRVLLDAGAVPRTLSAAAVIVRGDRDPQPIVALANEILALWNRPPIIQTVLRGEL
ncbi:SMI1/KNR4 family protein [Streptomyces sp. NPDC002265]|uniref:SMI1/KNR4 family protein n=1 Tax=Streptomyces sp. NPDC002265 TaxID=3154415 RepID=UPI003330B283